MSKKMYRFYQTSEKSAWTPVADSPTIVEEVKKLGAKKLTVLAVSEPVGEDSIKSKLSYKGPLYFDIDNKDDLAEAIKSTVTLVDRLINDYSVDEQDIKIFCSGSKGLHLFVNPLAFSSGRAQKSLPIIYKRMALDLHVIGLDYAPYSAGRGNCFRIENVQRADGNYRVPISIEDLRKLTPEAYVKYCSEPRGLAHPPEWPGVRSERLTALFELAKTEVLKKPKTVSEVTDSEIKEIKDEVPNCVMTLAEYKSVQSDKTFNQAAMQMAIYIARSGVEERLYQPVCDRMVEAAHSSQYDSVRKRKDHLDGQIQYMRSSPRMKFSCGGMRSLLSKRPCDGCPIDKMGSDALDESERLGIRAGVNGYFIAGKETEHCISTFTLEA